MAEESRSGSSRGGRDHPPVIRLVDFVEGDQRPEIGVYVFDRTGKPLHVAKVGAEGQFDSPEKVLAAAHMVALGPYIENAAELDHTSLSRFRPEHFRALIAERGAIEVPKAKWITWLFVTRCVNGSVSHCYPFPWILRDFLVQTAIAEPFEARRLSGASLPAGLPDVLVAGGLRKFRFPFRCEVVCDGLVEVYRRTCCCHPIIINDPRIPAILEELERVLPDLSPIRWPPRPDPPPWPDLPFFKDGTLDEKVLYARRDLHAIDTLPKAELAAHLQARFHLFCTCGAPVRVAQGFIQPDGEFHICWEERLQLWHPNCHDEFAFVVKQVINGNTVTIYNGVAANKWFRYGDDAALVSYHPYAVGCRHNDFPGVGAFVLLQDVGDTGSYNLKTPTATGWDRVAVPTYNDGLVFPATSAAAALGQWKDCNWGGTLLLRYHFSEPMKTVGAKYYRVSVSAVDSNGNPTGPRSYLSNSVTWKKYVLVGLNINVDSEVLGPVAVGGEASLFNIPYDADALWQSGQYHGALNTAGPEFTNGRYLLTLEVFDAAGQKLKPANAPPGDPGTAVAFTFRRWFQEVGPTAVVPFGALTHMLWWDNRRARAAIVDFRVNGSPSTDECQFLERAGSALFSVGYRAYHPDSMFQLYHRMWWRRGLNGPLGYLTSPDPNPNNVGQPPTPPGMSGSATFASMLGGHEKCSFALNLHVHVKTFDGQSRLTGLDDYEQAAFALEIV